MNIVTREAELIEPKKFRTKVKRKGFCEYEISEDGLLVLSYIRKKKGNNFYAATQPCPFCHKKAHYHGIGNGHRVAHCAGKFKIIFPHGEELYSSKGYILEETNEKGWPYHLNTLRRW